MYGIQMHQSLESVWKNKKKCNRCVAWEINTLVVTHDDVRITLKNFDIQERMCFYVSNMHYKLFLLMFEWILANCDIVGSKLIGRQSRAYLSAIPSHSLSLFQMAL